jgi:hypothetical protein
MSYLNITQNETDHIKNIKSRIHSQLHILGAVGTPCNLHTATATSILLSDSQNNTHNFSSNKSVIATFKSTTEPRPKHSKNNIYILLNESSCTFNLQKYKMLIQEKYVIINGNTKVINGNQKIMNGD